MDFQHQLSSVAQGRVYTATLFCGALGLVTAVVISWIGLLGKANSGIFELLQQLVFQNKEPEVLSALSLFLITGVLCFSLAFAVLDSPRMWRRLILGLSLLVLTLSLVPCLAVWNVYFPPGMSLVGVFWTWFSSMMYAKHNQMPCEQAQVVIARKLEANDDVDEVQVEAFIEDTDEKYKPGAG